MQNPKEQIESILVSMGLDNIAFNLPVKKQIDSLDLTALIIAVEDEWNISITDEDRDEIVTFDDLIKLIYLKTMEDKPNPTIDEQIQYLDVLQGVGHRPSMIKAIKENLLVIRLQMKMREAAQVSTTAKMYPLSPTELEYISGMGKEVEPPFDHPADNTSERPNSRGL